MDSEQIGKKSKRIIRAINRCRIYLKAESLADLCNAAGTFIRNEAFQCIAEGQTTDTSLWPQQPEPGIEHKKYWKSFLRKLCLGRTTQLRQPLGTWTASHHNIRWVTWFHQESGYLYHQSNDRTRVFRETTTDRGITKGHSVTDAPPAWYLPTMIPVDYRTFHRNVITTTAPVPIAQEHPQANTPWETAILENPSGVAYTLPPTWQEEWSELEEALGEGTPIIIHSDGSVKDNQGSFAWIIATPQQTIIHHQGAVDRNPITPFHAECVAATSAITFLATVCQLKSIATTSTITMYTDCKSLLPYMTGEAIHYKHASPLRKEFDVSQHLHNTIAATKTVLPGLKPGQYVKAHQTITEGSTWEAILNNDCDTAAKMFRQTHDYTTTISDSKPMTPYLRHKGKILSGNEIWTTRWAWRNRIFHEYLQERLSFSDEDDTSINWPAYAAATRNIPPSMKPFKVKLLIRWIAIGTRCVKYGSTLDSCHLCQEPETYPHLFQCPHKENDRSIYFTELRLFLQSIKTKPSIIEVMLTGITKWLQATTPMHQDISPEDPAYHPYMSQSHIGWDTTMAGVFHKTWAEMQSDDAETRTKWQAALSKWMILHSHEIWTKRCKARHETDNTTPSHGTKETLAQLDRLYEIAYAQLSPFDYRQLFGIPLQVQRLLPIQTLQAWIPPMYHAVRNQISRASANSGLQDIRAFFQTQQTTATDNPPTQPGITVGAIGPQETTPTPIPRATRLQDIRQFFTVNGTGITNHQHSQQAARSDRQQPQAGPGPDNATQPNRHTHPPNNEEGETSSPTPEGASPPPPPRANG
jgi:hypothetical protein